MSLQTNKEAINKSMEQFEDGRYVRLDELRAALDCVGDHIESVLYARTIQCVGEIFALSAIEKHIQLITRDAKTELSAHIEAECQELEKRIQEARTK